MDLQSQFEEVLFEIESSSSLRHLQLQIKRIQTLLVSLNTEISFDFTATFVSRFFQLIFKNEKVIKRFSDGIEIDIEETLLHKNVDRIALFNIFSEFLQTRRAEKTTVVKRRLIYQLFESAFLKEKDSIAVLVNILENAPGDLRPVAVAKLFRIPTDFFNFLEESPMELTDEFFLPRMIMVANRADCEICLCIINKIISVGSTGILVDRLVGNINEEEEKKWKGIRKCVRDHLSTKINKNYTVVGHLLKRVSEKTAEKEIENKVLSTRTYLEKIEENTFVQMLVDRVLFNFSFSTATSKIVISYLQKYLTLESQKKIFVKCLEVWRNDNFIRYSYVKLQYFVTNMIRQMMAVLPLESIEENAIMGNIQKGITFRFETFAHFEFVRACSHCVWKGLVAKLKLKVEECIDADELKAFNEYPDQMDIDGLEGVEDEKEATPQIQKTDTPQIEEVRIKKNGGEKPIIAVEDDSDQDSEEESYLEMNIDVSVDDPLILQAPKHLYDCLLGLRSDNQKRLEISLKHLNYLIRKNVVDLAVLWEELTGQLLRMHAVDASFPEFDEYKKRSLVSLCIFKPEQVSKLLIDRFFSEDSYLGDKHFLIGLFMSAAEELSDHPKKYATDLFNEFDAKDDGAFYFKKISTSYYQKDDKSEEMKKSDIIKKQRTEEKSRRWGDTRKRFEEARDSDANGLALKTIKRTDLLIINNQSDACFINQFNQLAQGFFFPLLVPLRTNHSKLLRKEVFLLSNVFSLITVYLSSARNSLLFYRMVEEALDYVEAFCDIVDLNCTRAMLQCVLKITTFVKKEVLPSHPIIVTKLVGVSQILAERGLQNEQDAANKYLVSVISNNIANLFVLDDLAIS